MIVVYVFWFYVWYMFRKSYQKPEVVELYKIVILRIHFFFWGGACFCGEVISFKEILKAQHLDSQISVILNWVQFTRRFWKDIPRSYGLPGIQGADQRLAVACLLSLVWFTIWEMINASYHISICCCSFSSHGYPRNCPQVNHTNWNSISLTEDFTPKDKYSLLKGVVPFC